MNPSTWGGAIPADGAIVHIPENIDVTIRSNILARHKSLRLDGKLSFATDASSVFRVETIIGSTSGVLEIGTTAQPIESEVEVRIIFIDEGPINLDADYQQYSKGLIMMGKTDVCGAEKNPWMALASPPTAGQQELQLAEIPTGWRVGDEVVIAGTEFGNPESDEKRTVAGITGSIIELDAPLARDHLPPPGTGFEVHIANLSRNVIWSSENPDIPRRAHAMFPHNLDVRLSYMRFYQMGRTNKRVQVDDWFFPTLVADVHEAGARTNIRGRYSLHFHRGGVDPNATTPAAVKGCAIEDDPGWAYVNHSSNVDFVDNVSYNVVGGAFQTESGDEIGSFKHNIALRTVNPDYPLLNPEFAPVDIRETSQDFAFQGDAFWFHGGGVEVEGNVASGSSGHGFIYWTEGQREVGTAFDLQNMFLVSNIPNGDLLPNLETIQSWWVPLSLFQNNTTYCSTNGFAGYYMHATIFEDFTELTDAYVQTLGSTIEDLLIWNSAKYGIELQNCERVTFRNLTVINDNAGQNEAIGILNWVTVANTTNWINCSVKGFQVGMRPPMQGNVHICGGEFTNETDFYIIPPQRDSRVPGNARDLRIEGVQFGINAAQYAPLGETPIYLAAHEALNGEIPLLDPEFQQKFFLIPDRITVDLPQLPEKRLFYNQQAPDFVPITSQNIWDAEGLYRQLIENKTNQKIFDASGLAFAGALLPANHETSALVVGGVVSDVDPEMLIPACQFIQQPLEPANFYDNFDFTACWNSAPSPDAGVFQVTPFQSCSTQPFTGSAVWVSPDGSDSNPGTLELPVRSFQAGADKAVLHGVDSVRFKPGHYVFDATAVLDTTHNGLVFVGQPGVVFSSLQPLSDWSACQSCSQQNVWSVSLPTGIEQVRFLYSQNEDWMHRAASPPFSTTEIAGGDDNGCIECNAYTPATQPDMSNIRYPASFTLPTETPPQWLDLRANTLPWALDLLPVNQVDAQQQRIYTQVPGLYDLRKDAHEAPPTAWLINSLDHLDETNEWVAFDGKLYVNAPAAPDTFWVPLLTELIRVDNGQTADSIEVSHPVQGITFQGITFTGGDYRTIKSDDVTSQHDWAVIDQPDALLRIRNAEGVTIDNCTFQKSGGTGLRFDKYNKNHVISNNVFAHLGRNGLVIAGRGAGFGDVCSGHQILTNQLSFTGMEDWDSPAIILDNCSGSDIRKNYLHDLYFSGLVLTATRQLAFAGIYEGARDFYVGREFRFWDISSTVLDFLFAIDDIFEASREAMQFTYNHSNQVSSNLLVNVATGQGMFQNGKVYVSGFPWSTQPDSLYSNTIEYNYFYDTFESGHADYVFYADSDMDSCLFKGNMMNSIENGELPLLILDNQWAEDELPGRGHIGSIGNLIRQSTFCGHLEQPNCLTIGKNYIEQGQILDGLGAEPSLLSTYQTMYTTLCPDQYPYLDEIPGAADVQSELAGIIEGFTGLPFSCDNSGQNSCIDSTVIITDTLLTQNLIRARDSVLISGTIIPDDSVVIRAGTIIRLMPGATLTGGEVSLKIEACPDLFEEIPEPIGRQESSSETLQFEQSGSQLPVLKLFPNPVAGTKLFVEVSGDGDHGVTGTILSSTGQPVYVLKNSSQVPSNQFSIDVSQYPNGLYFLVVEVNGNRITGKFVVQR